MLASAGAAPGQAAQYAKWSKIEIEFRGPASQGRGEVNPFAVRLDGTFVGPDGREFVVPGFYDGDGRGGLDGDVWKVRFSADREGDWSYSTRSAETQLDGRRGRFTVTGVNDQAAGFWRWGRLESVSAADNRLRYLKFRDGPYWLKAGCDDPENFLGSYRNYNTLQKRKAAVDYLAERGVNSLYFMTHNIGGDDNDVWPWLGDSAAQARRHGGPDARFDVAKLERWRQLLEHMQTRGVVPYLVLEDDSAWKGYDHDRYFRELLARFGYLPALTFNFGEEHNENYRLAQALAHTARLRQMDPYRHPLGIHNVNRPADEYIDAEHVDFTSIQTGSPNNPGRGLQSAMQLNARTIEWIERCRERGRRTLVVNYDEARPEGDRRCWWSVYLGGGVWESHVLMPYDRPLSAWEPVWTELGGARAFMETLPFWEMEPHNELVVQGRAFCLARPGQVYALYLPRGSATLQLPSGEFTLQWWNPANGKDGRFQEPAHVAGGRLRLEPPGDRDWALRVERE